MTVPTQKPTVSAASTRLMSKVTVEVLVLQDATSIKTDKKTARDTLTSGLELPHQQEPHLQLLPSLFNVVMKLFKSCLNSKVLVHLMDPDK
jgi:hypothetical protein